MRWCRFRTEFSNCASLLRNCVWTYPRPPRRCPHRSAQPHPQRAQRSRFLCRTPVQALRRQLRLLPRSRPREDTTRPSPIAHSRISSDVFLAEPSEPLGNHHVVSFEAAARSICSATYPSAGAPVRPPTGSMTAHTTGTPVLRPVVPQFPQVRRCIGDDEQKPVARPLAPEVVDDAGGGRLPVDGFPRKLNRPCCRPVSASGAVDHQVQQPDQPRYAALNWQLPHRSLPSASVRYDRHCARDGVGAPANRPTTPPLPPRSKGVTPVDCINRSRPINISDRAVVS